MSNVSLQDYYVKKDSITLIHFCHQLAGNKSRLMKIVELDPDEPLLFALTGSPPTSPAPYSCLTTLPPEQLNFQRVLAVLSATR